MRVRTLACAAISLLLAAASSVQLPPAAAQRAPRAIVLIAPRDRGLSEISFAAVRRAFSGEVTEVNGVRIAPFNYAPGDPLRVSFDRMALQLTPDEVGRFWVDRRIRGQGLPPRTVPTQRVMRRLVGKLTGDVAAIGYVSADQIDATVQPLKIDGKNYTDPGYAFALSAEP